MSVEVFSNGHMLLNTGVFPRVLGSDPRRSLYRMCGEQNDSGIELAVEWITFLSLFQEVPGSILGQEVDWGLCSLPQPYNKLLL
jgi:hypothetical protein